MEVEIAEVEGTSIRLSVSAPILSTWRTQMAARLQTSCDRRSSSKRSSRQLSHTAVINHSQKQNRYTYFSLKDSIYSCGWINIGKEKKRTTRNLRDRERKEGRKRTTRLLPSVSLHFTGPDVRVDIQQPRQKGEATDKNNGVFQLFVFCSFSSGTKRKKKKTDSH